jgi:hypothetical protein
LFIVFGLGLLKLLSQELFFLDEFIDFFIGLIFSLLDDGGKIFFWLVEDCITVLLFLLEFIKFVLNVLPVIVGCVLLVFKLVSELLDFIKLLSLDL